MNKKLLFILSFALISNLVFAQYYYLPNTNNPGNPGGLNSDPEYPNGSGMASGWTTILGGSNTTPSWSTTQNIPFNFNFNGVLVNQYKVSSSGVLTFTTSAATTVTGTTFYSRYSSRMGWNKRKCTKKTKNRPTTTIIGSFRSTSTTAI